MSFRCLVGSIMVEDIRHPKPGEVDLVFMAHRLRILKRFNGHPLALSVEEHHALTGCLVWGDDRSGTAQQWARLHDAHEYALGDLAGPLQLALGDAFADIASSWDVAILDALDISLPSASDFALVELCDRLAASIEWHFCLGRSDRLFADLDPSGPRGLDALTSALGAARVQEIADLRRQMAEPSAGASYWVL